MTAPILGHHVVNQNKMTTLTPRGSERRSGVERRTVDLRPAVLGPERDRRSGRERRSGTERRSGADGQSR